MKYLLSFAAGLASAKRFETWRAFTPYFVRWCDGKPGEFKKSHRHRDWGLTFGRRIEEEGKPWHSTLIGVQTLTEGSDK